MAASASRDCRMAVAAFARSCRSSCRLVPFKCTMGVTTAGCVMREGSCIVSVVRRYLYIHAACRCVKGEKTGTYELSTVSPRTQVWPSASTLQIVLDDARRGQYAATLRYMVQHEEEPPVSPMLTLNRLPLERARLVRGWNFHELA